MTPAPQALLVHLNPPPPPPLLGRLYRSKFHLNEPLTNPTLSPSKPLLFKIYPPPPPPPNHFYFHFVKASFPSSKGSTVFPWPFQLDAVSIKLRSPLLSVTTHTVAAQGVCRWWHTSPPGAHQRIPGWSRSLGMRHCRILRSASLLCSLDRWRQFVTE